MLKFHINFTTVKIINRFAIYLFMMIGLAGAQDDDSTPHLVSLIPDFQINENTSSSRHYNPVVLAQPNGDFVVAWSDERNDDIDVFLQRYDSNGNPLGPNRIVNDDAAHVSNLIAAIACDSTGRFVVLWVDARERKSIEYIYAQRFTVNGEKIGDNFRICDTNSEKNAASIAMRENGNFLVSWCAVGLKTVRYRAFFADGAAMGPSATLPARDGLNFNNVQCMLDGQNGYILVWQAFGDTTLSIVGRRIDFSLALKDSLLAIGDDCTPGSVPKLARSDSTTMVVWAGISEGKGNDIFARLLGVDGEPLGDPFIVNTYHSGLRYFRPAVTGLGAKKFLVTWEDARSGRSDVYFRVYNASDGMLSPEFQPEDKPDHSSAGNLAAAVSPTGITLFAWEDARNGGFEIFAQRLDREFDKIGDNFCVSDDKNSGRYYLPQIDQNSRGTVYAFWQSGAANIFMRELFFDGRLGPIVNISKFMLPIQGNLHPRFALGSEHFIVVWESDDKVYAQRFTPALQPLGDAWNLAVPNSYSAMDCDVSINSNDDFVVSWVDRPDRQFVVLAQRYDKNGQSVGEMIRVDDDPGGRGLTARMKDSRAVMANDGSCIVAWIDKRTPGNDRTFFQKIDPDGHLVGGNRAVDDIREFSTFALDMDDDGDFVIAWAAHKPGQSTNNLYARKFAADASPLTEAIQINEEGSSLYYFAWPQVSMNHDGSYAVCWQDDYFGNDDILMQLFDSRGEKQGPILRVNRDAQSAIQANPDVLCLNDQIWTVWEDTRKEGGGRNIFASLSEFNYAFPLAVNSEGYLVADLPVLKCYPNPFNESITINYYLPLAGSIQADVYDIRGRLAAQLISGVGRHGSNKLTWNGKRRDGVPLPSGVYFIRLNFENQILRRKIILLR